MLQAWICHHLPLTAAPNCEAKPERLAHRYDDGPGLRGRRPTDSILFYKSNLY